MAIEFSKLRKWQQEAFNNWSSVEGEGIFLGCTGSGKTIAALYCVQYIKAKTLIVVPTVVLMEQWAKEIEMNLDIPKNEIGMIGGGHNNICNITIAVVNSIRDKDLSAFDMIVLDEAHIYGSLENIKPLLNHNFKFKLGITATLKRSDGNDKELIDLIGDIVYTYNTADAVNDNVLSAFDIVNVGVDLEAINRASYDRHTKNISENFFPDVFKVAMSRSDSRKYKALSVVKSVSQRRAIINNAPNKMTALIEIVKKEKDKKIIIFNETIKMAELERKLLKKEGIDSGIYHSKMKNQDAVNSFKNGETNILISVKSLNEGLDVRDVDVGIRVAGNSQDRDTIQRLGRILRVAEGKAKAKYYQIYCSDTVESKYITKNTNTIALAADSVNWI